MRTAISVILALGLAGCAATSSTQQTYDQINKEMTKALENNAKPAVPESVSAALLPPLAPPVPKTREPVEERFSVTFNNVPASQFFYAVAVGSRYNMLVHPDVTGVISANLKNVTLFEALDAIRDLYGYEYTVESNRIVVKPLTLQTKVFQVNYLTGKRLGTSETRVNAGSLGGAQQQQGSGTAGSGTTGQLGAPSTTTGNNALNARSADSSKVSSIYTSDFWEELKAALLAIVGTDKDGRSVVISPQSGVVVVRAMPDELRNVTAYLKAAQLSIERQVILEAKILEVQLNDSYQTGINWASFASIMGISNNRVAAGFMGSGTSLSSAANSNNLTTSIATANPVTGGTGSTTVNATTSLATSVSGNPAGSLFSLAFQTNNFAALLSFLETQGTVHVLSSPRIATLNNQKAILKVGTDDFFVTDVSTTTTTTTSTTTTPSVTLKQFFSGVVLDVTPQIDENNNIILHIHPSVSQVSTVNKSVDLGTGGSLNLPLASSNISETDSVVRGQDGQIIAIGGLMRQASTSDQSQVPGAGNVPVLGNLFRSSNQVRQKRELVILLKPTIVQGDATWGRDMLESQQRMQMLDPRSAQGLR